MLGSTRFRHHCAHHQELATTALATTQAVWFSSCCWLEVKCRQDGWVSGQKAVHSPILTALNFQPAATREPDTTQSLFWRYQNFCTESTESNHSCCFCHNSGLRSHHTASSLFFPLLTLNFLHGLVGFDCFSYRTDETFFQYVYSFGWLSGPKAVHSSILPALNFQPATTREPDSLCGNQRYRRELLMMGIIVPETCWT